MREANEIERMREVLEQKAKDEPENAAKWQMYRFILGQRLGLRELVPPGIGHRQHSVIFKEVAKWIGNYMRPDTKLTELHRIENGEI